MLATLILAAVIGQTSQPEAKWYPMSSQPGWEGYGVPDGGLLVPVKWRQIGKPEVEWTLETKKVQKIEEVQEWKQTTVKAEKAPAVPELPTAQPTLQPAAPVVYGDPYGFIGWLNATRASYGLSAVGYDQNLSNWAAMNNDQQAARGMGHFVMGPARRQNSAMGAFANIGSMWMNSPAHRAALLDPTITAIGISGLGAYWTFNAY